VRKVVAVRKKNAIAKTNGTLSALVTTARCTLSHCEI